MNTVNPTYVRYYVRHYEKLLSLLVLNSSGSKVLEENVGFRFESADGKGLEQLKTIGSSLNTLERTLIIVFIITQ